MRKMRIANMLFAVGLAISFLLAPSPVPAQYRPPIAGSPSSRPGFSPYLNLTRNDVSPVISYYGIIRPQLGATAEFQQLQSQQNALAQQQQGYEAANVLPSTGHAAGFQTQGRYFLNKGGVGSGRPK
ncbi:MAG TPA: hypothetical protein VE988_11620 [Gemmataceae bacterium]|nr:hypothetical protein [Gemmataceae bacterium]